MLCNCQVHLSSLYPSLASPFAHYDTSIKKFSVQSVSFSLQNQDRSVLLEFPDFGHAKIKYRGAAAIHECNSLLASEEQLGMAVDPGIASA